MAGQDPEDQEDGVGASGLAFIAGLAALGGAAYFLARFFGMAPDRAGELGWGLALGLLGLACVALILGEGKPSRKVASKLDEGQVGKED
jgi:hypothetical protein